MYLLYMSMYVDVWQTDALVLICVDNDNAFAQSYDSVMSTTHTL